MILSKIFSRVSAACIAMSLAVGASLMLTSCSDEPENMECDIETIWVEVDDPSSLFYSATDVRKTVNTTAQGKWINWRVREESVLGSYPVCYTTTKGATVFFVDENGQRTAFSSGDVVDFSDERKTYVEVVSQDGQWSKRYTLFMTHDIQHAEPYDEVVSEDGLSVTRYYRMSFDFGAEGRDIHQGVSGDVGTYYLFRPTEENAKNTVFSGYQYWSNGNAGFALSRSSAPIEDYPTTAAIGAGPDGSDCIMMQTSSTGGLGRMARIYIAAGSLFCGSFDPQSAMRSRDAARTATRFGVPFAYKPLRMTVDMKYEPGPDYWNADKVVQPNIVDEPDAYIVLFRNDAGESGMLDGTDVLSSPRIVGKARLNHHFNADGSDKPSGNPIHGITREWQTFTFEMEYPNGDLDEQILKERGYWLVIGFSSSWQGADFCGALGSKLYVDNIKVEFSRTESIIAE